MNTAVTHDRLTYDFFKENLATTFTVQVKEGKSVELVLFEISPRKISRLNEYFSIIFHSPADFFLPQGMYSMESAVAGMIEVFIVPVGKENNEFLYEAVFNRILTT